jgi:hypothetical protein
MRQRSEEYLQVLGRGAMHIRCPNLVNEVTRAFFPAFSPNGAVEGLALHVPILKPWPGMELVAIA